MEKERPQSEHIWSKFDPAFPPEDGEHRKKNKYYKKTSAIGLFKHAKIKALSFLLFPRKIGLLFAIFFL